ncbi:MAG: single-stranded-DNA-specific exonuclease RecJ [Alphaproteobacteria bacterium]|nr:single-stranded-DNA-specific exonuclease RecJ [Alphaproteobacteria bacterium]
MDTPVFLKVGASLTGKTWRDRLDVAASRNALAIAQKTGMSDILARVIAGRGVSLDDASGFLEPAIRDLMPDPSTLAGLDETVARLVSAVARGETVALFGDYDVDGACSVALMQRFLGPLGAKVIPYIPDRIFEGYGPNIGAMDELIGKGASLIVTLDCGSTSIEPIAHARLRGADVLVIDHHQVLHELPPADAVVNPNRPDDLSGLGHLSAAGVTFMVLVGLNRALRRAGVTGLPDLMALVDLVALSTICDVVPLRGLNRAFVRRGLEVIRAGANRGLSALVLAARVSGPVNPYHLGYLIGPRINAGGRIGDAGLGARLLAGADEHEALAIAARLDDLNSERQRIEKQAVDEAIAAAEAEIGDGEGPPVLVLASEAWHPGIVGLVAARLKERFGRPAFAIALGPDGTGTGSGRSVQGADLGRAVTSAVEEGLLVKGGGHAMAAGITVMPGGIGALRAFLNATLAEDVAAARAGAAVLIDAALTARGAGLDLARDLERAGPFGMGNPGPVFAFPAHHIRFPQVVGTGGHIRFTLASGDGGRLKGIAFSAAGTPLGGALDTAGDMPLHVCGTLSINHWQGRDEVQFRLVDAARP